MKLIDLKQTSVEGKIILYRSPYDIGLKKVNGQLEVKDDSRIKATLPTLKYLMGKKCKIVLLTWVKRPDGKVVEALRTTPHASRLSELLGQPVKKVNDCVGQAVRERITALKPGELLMLENTRFHPEEMIDDDGFARELAKNGELVVFDAFPQAHRIHASTTGILRHLPACAGFYLQKEVEAFSKLITEPKKPFVVVIGGAKVSDKVDAINNLMNLVDQILVGGGVANVFLKAKGFEMGSSFMEDVFVDKAKKEKKDWVEYAREIMGKAKVTSDGGPQGLLRGGGSGIHLPLDLVLGDSLNNPKQTKIVSVKNTPDGGLTEKHPGGGATSQASLPRGGEKKELVPNDWVALDIGPQTASHYQKIISQAKTVFCNGPMGLFEDDRFATGSKAVVQAMSKIDGTKVISGGDTIESVNQFADLRSFSHVSLAGGATLEFLAGKKLPALEPLKIS
ncbi:phosphoglycerate kinase [Patescibacteria group bacterium]